MLILFATIFLTDMFLSQKRKRNKLEKAALKLDNGSPH